MKSTLKTILTALSIEKKQLIGNLARHQEQIQKKQNAIASLEQYANDYKQRLHQTTVHHMSGFQNQQRFLDRLFQILYSEKDALTALQETNTQLLNDFHKLDNKIDGIHNKLAQQQRDIQHHQDQKEESTLLDLATTRLCLHHLEQHS